MVLDTHERSHCLEDLSLLDTHESCRYRKDLPLLDTHDSSAVALQVRAADNPTPGSDDGHLRSSGHLSDHCSKQRVEVAEAVVQKMGPKENWGWEAFYLGLNAACRAACHASVVAALAPTARVEEVNYHVGPVATADDVSDRALACHPDAMNMAPLGIRATLCAFHLQVGKNRTHRTYLTCLDCMQAETRPQADFSFVEIHPQQPEH